MLMRDARQDRRKFFGTVVAGGEGKPPRLGISRFPNVKSCTKTNKFVAFGPFTYRFGNLGKIPTWGELCEAFGCVCVCVRGRGGINHVGSTALIA